MNCPTNHDKAISKEQCTNKYLIALTNHSEVEIELQNNNYNNFDVSLSLGPTERRHPDCNDANSNNNVTNRPYACPKTKFCGYRCVNAEISADIDRFNFKWPFLQDEMNRNSTFFRLESIVKLFESKQKRLENTMKYQEEVISNLQPENFLFQLKLVFLENLLFAPNPKTQVENNLDDEMRVCIIKESEKD